MVNGWALKPCKHLQIKNMETDTEHLQNEKKIWESKSEPKFLISPT